MSFLRKKIDLKNCGKNEIDNYPQKVKRWKWFNKNDFREVEEDTEIENNLSFKELVEKQINPINDTKKPIYGINNMNNLSLNKRIEELEKINQDLFLKQQEQQIQQEKLQQEQLKQQEQQQLQQQEEGESK